MTIRPLIYCCAVLFASCANLGTKTIYKSDQPTKLTKIGFANLDGDTVVSKIFPQTDSIFKKAVIETTRKYSITEVTPLNREFPIHNPDTTAIIDVCKANNLDGLIVSGLRFIHVSYSVNFVPIGKNYDTEVEMMVFNYQGKLLARVKHNTYKGNTYMKLPSADRTIYDGTKGALRRIAIELGWIQ